jgi:hypothetical protein
MNEILSVYPDIDTDLLDDKIKHFILFHIRNGKTRATSNYTLKQDNENSNDKNGILCISSSSTADESSADVTASSDLSTKLVNNLSSFSHPKGLNESEKLFPSSLSLSHFLSEPQQKTYTNKKVLMKFYSDTNDFINLINKNSKAPDQNRLNSQDNPLLLNILEHGLSFYLPLQFSNLSNFAARLFSLQFEAMHKNITVELYSLNPFPFLLNQQNYPNLDNGTVIHAIRKVVPTDGMNSSHTNQITNSQHQSSKNKRHKASSPSTGVLTNNPNPTPSNPSYPYQMNQLNASNPSLHHSY